MRLTWQKIIANKHAEQDKIVDKALDINIKIGLGSRQLQLKVFANQPVKPASLSELLECLTYVQP